MRLLLWVHIILMAVAAAFVIAAVVAAKRKKPGWFSQHRARALTGVLLAVTAFIGMFVFKVLMHFPHFHSTHSIIGLTALVLLVVTPLSGMLVASGAGKLRAAHRWLGRMTSLAVVLAVVAGIFRMAEIIRR